MEFNLRPKNIIIAGGGSGIGLSTAARLAQNGAKNIIIASRNLEKLKEAQKELMEITDHVHILQFDITNIGSHFELIETARNMIG